MTRPPPDAPGPASSAAGGGAGPGRPAGGDRRPLPDDVRDFLISLSQAAQKHGFYPGGHPALEPIVDEVMEALEPVLRDRDRLSVGVAPDRLVLEETETDPDRPVLSSLAERLHQHELARVSVLSGVEAGEIAAFLGEVSERVDRREDSLGARAQVADEWPHVTVEPVRYERFSMAEDETGTAGVEEVEERAEELWTGLARSALTEEALEEIGEGTPPVEKMVAALERFSEDVARSREAAARMLALAETLDDQGPEAAPEVRDRFVDLLEQVDPATMGAILRTAAPEQRQRFMSATADWLPAGTIVDLMEEVADSRSLGLSFQMLRLLSKLSSYVGDGPEAEDHVADTAFREQVRRLVEGWGENIREGEAGRALDRIAGADRGLVAGPGAMVEPERVVQTALEADTLGAVGTAAVEQMLEEDRLERLLELVRGVPSPRPAAEEIWERLGTEEVLRDLLEEGEPDFAALDDMIQRMGGRAAGPMLDALSEAGSRSVRGQLFSRLAGMEGEVVPAILERLEDDRWFVKRNMLALLEARPRTPDGFSALPFTRHPEAPVRREAYKLAFADPGDRAEGLERALRDDDRQAAHLGIGALDEVEPEVVDALVPVLRQLLRRDDLTAGMLRPVVRALGRARREEALEALTDLCRTRKMWRFWTTDLTEKSTVMLEALRALARGWAEAPAAARVLERARSDDDPEIREAAAGEGGER